MSSVKRFEKTFSRKKKESNEIKKEENDGDELVIALLSQSQKRKTLDNRINGDKSKNGNKEDDKQKLADYRKPKQKQQNQPKQNQNLGQDKNPKQKRKAENEEVKNTKKEKTMMVITKDVNQGKEKEKVNEECLECTFPTNRIVRIVKNEGSDYRISQEAIFLINKATEKFIELFSEDAYDCAVQDKKSFVGYKHLSSSIGKEKRLDFLSDFVPEKVAVEKALAEWKPAETLPS